MMEVTFVEALKESTKEQPIMFSTGQEIDLHLAGNLHVKVVSKVAGGVKLWREKHNDRLSSSIVIETDDILLDIEQTKGIHMKQSPKLWYCELTDWINANVLKEHLFAIIAVPNSVDYHSVLYWG